MTKGRLIRALAAVVMLGAQTASAQEAGALARYLSGGFEDRFFGAPRLELHLSQGVPWRVFTLADPNRLVVDFREVSWQGIDPVVLDNSVAISEVRLGPFRPGWSRLIAGLAQPLEVAQAGLRIDPEDQTAHLSIALAPVAEDVFAAKANPMPRDSWDEARPSQITPTPDEDAFVVMLDPGHGGIDPGALRDDVSEAQLMLQFARELREVLLRAGVDQVKMTRSGDYFVSLEERIALTSAARADVFVSLHADALYQGVAKGATVYTLSDDASDAASAALAERHERDGLLSGLDLRGSEDRVAGVLLDLARIDNAPRSSALAQHVVESIKNALGYVHKRPLRQAGFSVLKSADTPSILIELGFLSTAEEMRNLQDPTWRAAMAAGIRDGLLDWTREDEALRALRRQ